MGRRIHATRLLTGQVLDNDLGVLSHTSSRELNGPGGVFGRVSPALARRYAPDGRKVLEPWSTALYMVDDETYQIVAAGILTSVSDKGLERDFMCPGFTTIPEEQPFLATYSPDDFEDPVTIYRALWQHLAAFPGGNIGMNIDADPTYLVVGSGGEPFQIIETDYQEVGSMMSDLLTASKIDYREHSEFVTSVTTSASPTIRRSVKLGFPRLGANRTQTMRFTEGENVTEVSEVVYGGGDYSRDVTVLGAGEGWARVDDGLAARAHTDDGRVRRAKVVSDPSLQTPAQVEMRLKREMERRDQKVEIADFTIKDHPNCRINDLNPGDDIILRYYSDHHGRDEFAYLRVMGIDESSDSPGTALIRVEPSDSFDYMPAENPYTDGGAFLVEV